MARSRRSRSQWDTEEVFSSLVLLVMFLALFVPGVRHVILNLGFVLLTLISLAAVAVVGFIIYEFIQRRRFRNEMITPRRAFNLDRIESEVIVSPPPAYTPTRPAPDDSR